MVWQKFLDEKYAKICGAIGLNVSKPEELPEAVEKALSTSKPTIVDINTDPRRFV